MVIESSSGAAMKQVCRSCMQESAEMRSLFDVSLEEHLGLKLADMMVACASVQVATGDGLPESLCLTCEAKLHTAYQFKQQCESSDEKLRKGYVGKVDYEDVKDDFFDEPMDQSDSDWGSPKVLKKEDLEAVTAGYGCDECDKVFTTSKGLRMHKRKHLNERAKQVKEKKMVKSEDVGDEEEDDEHDVSYSEMTAAGEKFECCYCYKMLNTKDGLRIHMRRHTNPNMFQCNVCSKKFTKTNHLKRHMMNVHAEQLQFEKTAKKVMQCEFCDRNFKYKKSFSQHMQTEHGVEEDSDTPLSEIMKCTIPEIVQVEADLRDNVENDAGSENTIKEEIHQRLEHCDDQDGAVDEADYVESAPVKTIEKPRHQCHVCNDTFTRVNHLTRHMTLHRAVLLHKCDKCDKAYATSDFLEKHRQEDHVNKPYACLSCDRQFTRGEHLIRHLKLHEKPSGDSSGTPLKCSVCNHTQEFDSYEELMQHIKIHLQNDKRHICGHCGKAFNRLDNLKTHQRIHTGQKDTSKLHLCVYCGKEFNNSSNMTVHMRRHTGERPYKCAICGKGFPRSHDLKCHERTHSGEKPYLCTLCGKSFNKSNKLLRHSRVHTGERPYLCNLCGRAFTQSNDLALHMRRHTGSRPYACGVCPARFIQSCQLKTHRRTTGHWMDTQPDLKGGHRVEPVVPTGEPAPIKFKTYNQPKPNDVKEEMHGIEVRPDGDQPLMFEASKLLEQFPHLEPVRSTNVISKVVGSGEEKVVSATTFQVYATTSATVGSSYTNSGSYAFNSNYT